MHTAGCAALHGSHCHLVRVAPFIQRMSRLMDHREDGAFQIIWVIVVRNPHIFIVETVGKRTVSYTHLDVYKRQYEWSEGFNPYWVYEKYGFHKVEQLSGSVIVMSKKIP